MQQVEFNDGTLAYRLANLRRLYLHALYGNKVTSDEVNRLAGRGRVAHSDSVSPGKISIIIQHI